MISAQEYIARQHRLLSMCEPESLCIIPAGTAVTRSQDTDYPFRQDSNFWYLTGFNEPSAWLLVSNHSQFSEPYRAMVFQPKDKDAEMWQGKRLGADAGLSEFALDEAFELDELEEVLAQWCAGHDHVYFPFSRQGTSFETLMTVFNKLKYAPRENLSPAGLHDIEPFIHEMRLYKSSCEIALMKAAAKITSAAHIRAMKYAHPGCYEYQLEAELHHEFAMAGARSPAYATIVGSGENACILHYTENQAQVNENDLILIDAGAEYLGYAADITRTFPAKGTFSTAQKTLYNLVLDAQTAVLDRLAPGMTLKEASDIAAKVITEGLIEVGILSGSLSENLEKQTFRQFFMHGLGHYLGLDVHDVGDYRQDGKDRPLQPGMVITVEPGIYISPDAAVTPEFKGIGIRIEDNVVITATGIDIMTADVPKTPDDIEALMGNK